MAIIAIVSGSYCHGDEITSAVARQLSYRTIDSDILQTTVDRFDVNRERLLQAVNGPEPFLKKAVRERRKLVAWLEAVVAESMAADNVIMTGYPCYMIPGNIGHVLKVCLIAHQGYRVEQAKASDGESEATLVAKIQEYDAGLSYISNFLADLPAYDERLFDIIIPVNEIPVEAAVEMICTHAHADAVKTTDRSRMAVADFILGAKVKVALAEAGYDVRVFAEKGNVLVTHNERAILMGKLENKIKGVAGKIAGVAEVTVKPGPGVSPPSLNPWDNIDMPPKILLVDDEKEFVHTLSERLKTRNLESSIAYDGEQALDMLKDELPDVIVLDIMMPGIDGIETLRRVKAKHPEVEVIILTGHGSEQEQEQAEELGAFAYLHKPVNINELAQKMKEAYAHAQRGR